MKNILKTLVLIACFIFSSNSSNAQISYDYDREADFNSYKTYSFGGWQNDSGKIANDLDKRRLMESFKTEFTKRGMVYTQENADVVVTLFLVVDTKTSTTSYTDYQTTGGGYGYRRGYRAGWGWGTGSATTVYNESDYEEGTLVMDMYDSKTDKLVWQGVAKGTIDRNAKNREKKIPKRIKKLMKKYPIKPEK